MEQDREHIKNIGALCKKFRQDKKVRLSYLSKKTGTNYRTLASFERGQSTNIMIVVTYHNFFKKLGFGNEFVDLIERGLFNGTES